MNPMTHPIYKGNVGIARLRKEVAAVRTIRSRVLTRKRPIVLVPGFNGWSRPLLGTVNYFGGFEDLPLILSRLGYIVIVVRIGPISTNRERACEIFSQLTNINLGGPGNRGFDRPGVVAANLIDVNFGTAHPSPHPASVAAAKTWQAVVYDIPANPLSATWRWNADNKVNFICHSQGGTTLRYLIELLSGTRDQNLPQFLGINRQNWINSVVTLGTPHKGTTITDVDFLPPGNLDLLIDLITSCSFEARPNRIYDLHLDHWGFKRDDILGETYQAMRANIAPDVAAWWTGNNNGLFDNSIPGVANLDAFAPKPSPDIFYFTMSFCATQPFPTRFLDSQDINEFLAMFPFNQIWNPLGIWGKAFAPFQKLGTRLGVLPTLHAALTWITDLANRHLQQLGYFSRIPRPGTQVPRPDMLPVIAPSAYAMGGRNTHHVIPGIKSDELRPNDGVVNTESMDGPVAGPVNNGSFAARLAAKSAAGARGIYWHLGTNSTIDHADQIGVFTSPTTNLEVQVMYMLFAELGDLLS